MNINLTLLGQLIAFGLFAAFCIRWVWPPMQEVFELRRQRIAKGLEDARAAEAERASAGAQAGEQLNEARRQAAEITETARQRSAAMLEEARREAEELVESGRRRAEEETGRQLASARDALRSEIGSLAVATARKALGNAVGKAERDKMLRQMAKGD